MSAFGPSQSDSGISVLLHGLLCSSGCREIEAGEGQPLMDSEDHEFLRIRGESYRVESGFPTHGS